MVVMLVVGSSIRSSCGEWLGGWYEWVSK